jgi:hypothetical protein
MPANKLKPQKLQCPFCSAISMRGTGLSAHVRGQHAKEYANWNKNPNRMIEAAAASPKQERKASGRIRSIGSPEPVEIVKAAAGPSRHQPRTLPTRGKQTTQSDVNNPLVMLQKAHEQLSARKQMIESELVRIEELRGEHETIAKQVAAIDEALKAFHG